MAPVPTEIAVKNEAAADEMVLPTVTVKEEVQDRDESQGESLQVPFTEGMAPLKLSLHIAAFGICLDCHVAFACFAGTVHAYEIAVQLAHMQQFFRMSSLIYNFIYAKPAYVLKLR